MNLTDSPGVTPGAALAGQENAGAYTKRVVGIAAGSIVGAGHGGSGTAIAGIAIDRCDPDVALSLIPAIPVHAVLASGHTAIFAIGIQDSDDDGVADAYADYGDAPDTLTVTALNSGAAIDLDAGGLVNIDLSGAKRYVKLSLTPTLSASGVDVVTIGGCVAVLGGFDHNPPA
jgi:hypothetical protein